jgi:hypothetical protein
MFCLRGVVKLLLGSQQNSVSQLFGNPLVVGYKCTRGTLLLLTYYSI